MVKSIVHMFGMLLFNTLQNKENMYFRLFGKVMKHDVFNMKHRNMNWICYVYRMLYALNDMFSSLVCSDAFDETKRN